MKSDYSNIYSFNKKTLTKTLRYLNKGEIAGLPTETVYGLAGNAYSSKAIKKIFRLKKRPKKNPLIIHYYDINSINKDVIISKNFVKLYKKFCPGPLTFILKKNKNSKIVKKATAGLKTIAIRFPSHKIVRSILKYSNFPLAMPSANISTRISPVNAIDVFEDFGKKINIIIDGGKSKIGIESTVIDLTGKPKILRPGVFGYQDFKKILKVNSYKKSKLIKSPGMLEKHYSPGIPIILNKNPKNKSDAHVIFGNKFKGKKNKFNLSKKANLNEAASNLYKILRDIKNKGYKKIYVSKIPNTGPGIAINDRLRKAAK